jgi:ribosomal protein L35
MKTNKSFTKRIKVTRTGKIIARKAGQDHFNAKERGRTKGVKKRGITLSLSNRLTRRFLGGNAKKKSRPAAEVAA